MWKTAKKKNYMRETKMQMIDFSLKEARRQCDIFFKYLKKITVNLNFTYISMRETIQKMNVGTIFLISPKVIIVTVILVLDKLIHHIQCIFLALIFSWKLIWERLFPEKHELSMQRIKGDVTVDSTDIEKIKSEYCIFMSINLNTWFK